MANYKVLHSMVGYTAYKDSDKVVRRGGKL